jgi:ketosteroid isomerase-like protein
MEHMRQALNAHDLAAFLACFDPNYVSEQPAHPDRAFGGIDQVRKNWATMFDSLPDFKAELRAVSEDGSTAWSEWQWTATQADGSTFDWRGVTVMGVDDGRVTWARLYMEPTDFGGAGIDAAVREMTGVRASER